MTEASRAEWRHHIKETNRSASVSGSHSYYWLVPAHFILLCPPAPMLPPPPPPPPHSAPFAISPPPPHLDKLRQSQLGAQMKHSGADNKAIAPVSMPAL